VRRRVANSALEAGQTWPASSFAVRFPPEAHLPAEARLLAAEQFFLLVEQAVRSVLRFEAATSSATCWGPVTRDKK
jgi:hypothetical protein